MSDFKSEIVEQAKRLGRALTSGEVAAINAEYVRWSDAEIASLRQQLDQKQADLDRALARVAELEDGVKEAVSSPFGYQGQVVRKLLADKSQSWLLRKQAEAVVPAIMVTAREFGRPDITYSAVRMFAEDYAQRLRQQADELENENVI